MKNIYITWHYTTHGISYLKNILAQFHQEKNLAEKIHWGNLDQKKLDEYFTHSVNNGFLFDEIIYLHAPQESFDRISRRRFDYKKNILEDPLIIKGGLRELYQELIDKKLLTNIEEDFHYIKEHHPEKIEKFSNLIWRNIHHYSVDCQLNWLTDYSNLHPDLKKVFKSHDLSINDFRDEAEIATKLHSWLHQYTKQKKDHQFIINVSLGSTETQVAWHILAESGRLPSNTRFIKTYDNKSDATKRFKDFQIKEIPVNILTNISDALHVYQSPKSPQRKLVDLKMKVFLDSGFSILLLGERGTGKSRIANQPKEGGKKINLVEANCASFDDDSKAESELFGYTKGAFTGAEKDKNGLLIEANGGVLFLDEVHHLSKTVQAKLMKAIQTDKDNKMKIRRLGAGKEQKVEVRLIFASNLTVEELKKVLLPDFYDRIAQQVIEIPPLRETPTDRMDDWKAAWDGLYEKINLALPNDTSLENWLRKLPLFGNFRDLQKIAIYYKTYTDFKKDKAILKLIEEKSAFEYAKAQFEKYHSPNTDYDIDRFHFNENETTSQMIAEYKYELQKWAVDKFNGRKNAIEHFRSLGDSVCPKTFNNWKNKVV